MAPSMARYGNWVSKSLVYRTGLPALVFIGLSFISPYFLIGAVLCLVACGYLAHARYRFSVDGGDIQGRIQDLLLECVPADGHARVLDIGCGDGRLTIKIAQRCPSAHITAIDYFGGQWECSQAECAANAAAEGVAERVTFQQASAASLPFEDGAFDLVVSNMVFHEVGDLADKKLGIQEALRVLRDGGRFVFQDIFGVKQIYGSPDDLIRTLKGWGVSQAEYVDTSKSSFIPTSLRLPFMAGAIGMIHGTK